MHGDDVCRLFHGKRWTQQQQDRSDEEEAAVIERYTLNWVAGAWGDGIGRDRLHYGGHSGYQAINLAYLWGARRIILIGYDASSGGAHFFGRHPAPLDVATQYQEFMPAYRRLAADLAAEGVEVLNCSRATAIDAFPRGSL